MGSDVTPSSRPRPEAARRPINVATGYFSAADFALPPPTDLRDAYSTARGLAAIAPPLDGPGHRLTLVQGGAFTNAVLSATRGEHAIVGRHTSCDIVMPDDPELSLRHLLVRSTLTSDGTPVLRVLDLDTQVGFDLGTGMRSQSLLAAGPLAIRIGRLALVALPTDATGGPLPPMLPAPDLAPVSGRDIDASLGSPYRTAPRRGLSNSVSRVTLLPRPITVGEGPLQPPTPSSGHGITVEREGRWVALSLSPHDLDRGVLLGRSPKCRHEAVRALTSSGTSRVHVLMLREAGQVVAYDLASTQGVFVAGRRVRRVPLSNDGTELVLGFENAVRMYWHPVLSR
jgi:hypothetical protein